MRLRAELNGDPSSAGAAAVEPVFKSPGRNFGRSGRVSSSTSETPSPRRSPFRRNATGSGSGSGLPATLPPAPSAPPPLPPVVVTPPAPPARAFAAPGGPRCGIVLCPYPPFQRDAKYCNNEHRKCGNGTKGSFSILTLRSSAA